MDRTGDTMRVGSHNGVKFIIKLLSIIPSIVFLLKSAI